MNHSTDMTQLENALKAMGTVLDSTVTQAIDFLKAEEESTLQAKILVDDMSRAEITHLQEQNALLVQILEAEKVKSASEKDRLVQRISNLLGDFVASRDHQLQAAFGAVADANAKNEEEFSKFGQRHELLMNEAVLRGSEAVTSFECIGTEGKRTRDGALKVSDFRLDKFGPSDGKTLQTVGSVQVALTDGVSSMHNSVTTATTTYTGELQRQSQILQTSFGAGKWSCFSSST